MKSLWSKASEIGSKAKNIANDYLQTEKKNLKPEIEEIEKAYGEKFSGLSKDIDTFKRDTMKTFDQKMKQLDKEISELKNENTTKEEDLNKLNEEIKTLKDAKLKLEEEKSDEINKLKDQLKEREEQVLSLEKKNQDLLSQQIKDNEGKVKENFLTNFDDLIKMISSLQLEEIINSGDIAPKFDEIMAADNDEKITEIKTELKELMMKKFDDYSNEIKDNNSKIINDIKSKVDENLNNLKEKLNEYSTKSQSMLQENAENKETIHKLKQDLSDANHKCDSFITELDKLKNEFTTKEQEVNTMKEEHDRISNKQQDRIDSMQQEYKDLEEKLKQSQQEIENKSNEVKEITEKDRKLKSLAETSLQNLNKIKQTFKQFFLLQLEDDIFIDIIEATFKDTNTDAFFEEVYKLSKLIKPRVIFSLYSQILNKEDLAKRLNKYNLSLEDEIKNFQSLNSKEQIDSLNLDDMENNFIQKLILELCSYIDNLNNTILKQTKIISDLNVQLKSAKETLEEGKKNDTEKYDLLNKHISKLQQECRDSLKTEKLLRENIDNLENTLKDVRSENEKLSNKGRILSNANEDLGKEKSVLTDKISLVTQQCEIYKVENLELNEKNNNMNDEIKGLKDKVEILIREKGDMMSKITEIDKLKQTLHDKVDVITQKETEITKLKNSYINLEEFIENLKSERDHALDMYKKQIFEMAGEIDMLKETNRVLEDTRISQTEINNNQKIEELEKVITDLELENKHLTEQKDKMKKYSEEILFKVKNDLKDTEFLVDKRMISSILMKYFDRNSNEKLKLALLDTLANFMGYSNEERKSLGLHVNTTVMPQNNSSNHDKLKELSDGLYNFILNA